MAQEYPYLRLNKYDQILEATSVFANGVPAPTEPSNYLINTQMQFHSGNEADFYDEFDKRFMNENFKYIKTVDNMVVVIFILNEMSITRNYTHQILRNMSIDAWEKEQNMMMFKHEIEFSQDRKPDEDFEQEWAD